MKRVIRRTGFVLLTAIASGAFLNQAVFAESASGLRELLLEISARHPRVLERAGDLAARLAAANYKSSRYPDPGFGVAWSNYPYKKDLRLIEDRTPMTGVEFSVSQPIPFPGRLTLESKIADVDATASRLRLAVEKNELAREFLGTLIEIKALHETIAITKAYAERIKIVSEVANLRYSVGKGDLTDVSKASVRYATFNDRIRTLEGAAEVRNRKLAYYTEDTAAITAILSERQDLPDYIKNLSRLLSNDQLNIERESLAVAMASLEIDRQEKEENLAEMNYLPDFEVFASYRKRAYIQNDPARDEDFMSFGFKMRVPLWSALANHDNVEAKSEMQKSARFSERNVIERERSLLDSARINYATLNDRLVAYDETLIPQATRSVDSARLAYETGRTNFDAFQNSWEMLYNLEAERIRLRADRDAQVLVMAFILNVILPDHAANQIKTVPTDNGEQS